MMVRSEQQQPRRTSRHLPSRPRKGKGGFRSNNLVPVASSVSRVDEEDSGLGDSSVDSEMTVSQNVFVPTASTYNTLHTPPMGHPVLQKGSSHTLTSVQNAANRSYSNGKSGSRGKLDSVFVECTNSNSNSSSQNCIWFKSEPIEQLSGESSCYSQDKKPIDVLPTSFREQSSFGSSVSNILCESLSNGSSNVRNGCFAPKIVSVASSDSMPMINLKDESLSSNVSSGSKRIANKRARIARPSLTLQTSKPVKLPRLDLNEEANELPDAAVAKGPQILSFRNVPDLLGQSGETLSLASLHPSILEPVEYKAFTSPIEEKVEINRRSESRAKRFSDGGFSSISSDGTCELVLINQPEMQHRARYQTEGSRGAVKDRSGYGFPVVKLSGYNKPCTLQVFVASPEIASQMNGGLVKVCVTPHVYYQTCRVSGKNSSPCHEERVAGTAILKMEMHPDKDMMICCDCVGILKERNVDIEQRMKLTAVKSRKKSTKCRLAFRVHVTLSDGQKEILQVVSQPISCTQPPGVPEVQRQSLKSCPVTGGVEMFILGKNFLKETHVLFTLSDSDDTILWQEKVKPDKDCLQPTSLVCTVPAIREPYNQEECCVQVSVESCGKSSESQPLRYLPVPAPIGTTKHVEKKTLPKGVSPSAVEFNRAYAESGQLILPSKPICQVQCVGTQTVTPVDVTKVDLENPLPQDIQIGGNVAMGELNALNVAENKSTIEFTQHYQIPRNEQIQTFQQDVHYNQPPVLNQTTNENVLTTIDERALGNIVPQEKFIQAPQIPSGSSFQKAKPAILTNEPLGLPKGIMTEENPCMHPSASGEILNRLVDVLRLVKTLPNSIQNSMVDLIADEIHNQLKVKFSESKNAPQKSVPTTISTDKGCKLTKTEQPPIESVFTNSTLNSQNVEPCLSQTLKSEKIPVNHMSSIASSISLPLAIITPSLRLKPGEIQSYSNFTQNSYVNSMNNSIPAINNIGLKQNTVVSTMPEQQSTFQLQNQNYYPVNKSVNNENFEVKMHQVEVQPECTSLSYSVDGYNPIASRNEIRTENRVSQSHIPVQMHPKLNPLPRNEIPQSQLLEQNSNSCNSISIDKSNSQMSIGINISDTNEISSNSTIEKMPGVSYITGTTIQIPTTSNAELITPNTSTDNQCISTISNQGMAFTNSFYRSSSPTFTTNQIHVSHNISGVSELSNGGHCELAVSSESGSLSHSVVAVSSHSVVTNDPLLSEVSSALPIAQPVSRFLEAGIEGPFSQLSETELMNYINPQCFDNV